MSENKSDLTEEQVIIRRREWAECENCGEPAVYKNTYLLDGARSNPSSSAYRKDDCTWCSDHDQFLCGSCQESEHWAGVPDGYSWCSTFDSTRGGLRHLFLRWYDFPAPDLKAQRDELLAALQGLGVLPGGYCFCFGHDRNAHKPERTHTGECLAARAAIQKARGETE